MPGIFHLFILIEMRSPRMRSEVIDWRENFYAGIGGAIETTQVGYKYCGRFWQNVNKKKISTGIKGLLSAWHIKFAIHIRSNQSAYLKYYHFVCYNNHSVCTISSEQ